MMPTKKITDLFAERAKALGGRRTDYFDSSFGGLALRVTEHGHKSWSLHYRMSGRLRRLTLGAYPALLPKDARRAAMKALERVRDGVDPAEEKRQRRDTAAVALADTFAACLTDYLIAVRRNTAPSTTREVQRVLTREFLPYWRNRPIGSITRGDISHRISAIVGRGADVMANRALSYLRRLFTWAMNEGRLAASPLTGMKPPAKETTRDRVLDDDEIRWLLRACDSEGEHWSGLLTKLLLLTAQRRDEVAGMRWSELDLANATWRLSGERTKNGQAHEIHLSDAACAILNKMPRISDYAFTVTGTTPVTGFSKVKRRLDAAALAAKRAELGPECDAVPGWTHHDLRRTAATGMARLGVAPHVVDKILNHVSGSIKGVARIYNRYECLPERRTALEAWGRHVAALASGTEAASNVRTLRR
jgi:integrase